MLSKAQYQAAQIKEYHGLPGRQWPNTDVGVTKSTIRGKDALNKAIKDLAKKRLAKKKETQTEDYAATQNAIAHAKKDGANYHKDVSVQHKYDAYHMKKAGFTHRKYGGYGSYSYNKHGDGNRIRSSDHHGVSEGMGAAYMPDTDEKKTAGREITSKAVLKQLNRNRNKGAMKGKVRTPNVRYVHDRQRETDLTAAQRGKTVINPEDQEKQGNKGKKGKRTASRKAKSPQSRKRKSRK